MPVITQQNVTSRHEILSLFPPGNIVGVEVGTDTGINARELLLSRPDVFLWTVDPYVTCPGYEPDVGREVALREREMRVGEFDRAGRSKHIRLSSVDAAKHFSGNLRYEGLNRCMSFNFIYIDADHSEQAVTEDIKAWWPLLHSGGMMAGHDFEFPGVHTPVIQFARNNGLDLHIINERGDPKVTVPESWKGPGWRPGHTLDKHGGWSLPSWMVWKP
jgi:Methyltransferase domain